MRHGLRPIGWGAVATVLGALAVGMIILLERLSTIQQGVGALRDGAAVTGTTSGPTRVVLPSAMIRLEYSYESAECGTVTITTVCGVDYAGEPIEGGETMEECVARHREAIARMKELCPPAE